MLKSSDKDLFFRWFKEYAETHLGWWRKKFGTNPSMKKGFVEEQWELLLKASEDPSCFVKVARMNGALVGILWAKVKQDDWFDCQVGMINWVYVDPKHAKQGIGTTLMEQVEKWFKEKGVQGKMLNVSGQNKEAIRLYQKFGYEIVDHRMLGRGYDKS